MNIILIVVDTLRASRLGCYGYTKRTTPFIDSLAVNGARFKRCFAPGIPTAPAHTTLFTGLHPISHNIVSHNGAADLSLDIPVLPELMQAAGYRTAAIDNLRSLKPWFARGYDEYIDPSDNRKLRLLVSCEEINAAAVPWIKNRARDPFFLFVHYWEPHTPYLPPARFQTFYSPDRDPCSPEFHSFDPIKRQPFWTMFGDTWFEKLGPITDAEYIASLYDAEVRHVDDGLEELIGAVRSAGIANETLILITGDHGESLYSHDIYFDHHGLYEDVIHVPLLVYGPELVACSQIDGMVQHLDVAPTILAAAGASPCLTMDGHNHWPGLSGNSDFDCWDRVICCESTWQSKWAIRTSTEKFILARAQDQHNSPPRELYDLTIDPREEHNLALTHWRRTAELEAELEAWIAGCLQALGRSIDPLIEQGITLGKRWETWAPA